MWGAASSPSVVVLGAVTGASMKETPSLARPSDVGRAQHTGTVEDLLTRISADAAHGLGSADARERLARDGKNELPQAPRPSALKQFFQQFANPIVLTLLGAAVVAVINGASNAGEESFLVRYGDAIAIFLIVALNAVLGYYQERRAEAALDALQQMQTPHARVRRDDQVSIVSAIELVVGDILELEAGDAVPADARLLQSINLAAQEGTLTGESMPVGKDARAELPVDAPLGDRTNMLFLGTTLVRGKARAVVSSTGRNTELGKTASLMSGPRETKTPLEEKLERFGKRILWVCLGLSGLLFAWGMLKHGRAWHELLLEAVSLAVAAIPEGLPAITTITLALGMQRMARRGAIIRKLAAVETLGSATIICTDKTGTLTQNEMTVREVYAAGVTYNVSGTGYDPKGEIVHPDGSVIEAPSGALRDLLATAALCNNAALERKDDGGWRTVGDPTEGALLTLAAKGGVPKESVAPALQVVKELPFDSDRKRMTVVTLDEFGLEVVHTKGSADVLLPLCSSHDGVGGVVPLDDETRKAILREAERMSGDSLRVLAVARRELSRGPDSEPQSNRPSVELEQRLTFLGLAGMLDPPRQGVKEAIRASAEAQVGVVMITGDHKLTAVAIAKELGLWSDADLALTGAELETLSDAELAARIDSVRVFARVTAEQKLRIVRAFKARGHVVAMTGDGVNDAPALREAHIGVAMGRDGTDVARQAADMVLADDNFATIVDAVREGRAIWRNIQKFIFFLLSSNAGLLVTVFAASFIPSTPPLRPLMILWINLVTNGLPALALGVDPPDPTQMMEPPRKPSADLLGAREYLGMLVVGVWMGGCALACYLWPWAEPDRPLFARAVAFSLLALSPLFHAFNCRSATASVFALRPLVSAPLVLAVVLSAAIHLVAVLVPQLRAVFATYAMNAEEWAILVLLSASIIPALELVKLLQRRGMVGADLGPMSRRPDT
jgi:P-type Ca2+ transporter type 2C